MHLSDVGHTPAELIYAIREHDPDAVVVASASPEHLQALEVLAAETLLLHPAYERFRTVRGEVQERLTGFGLLREEGQVPSPSAQPSSERGSTNASGGSRALAGVCVPVPCRAAPGAPRPKLEPITCGRPSVTCRSTRWSRSGSTTAMGSSKVSSGAIDPGTLVEVGPPRGRLPSDTGFRVAIQQEPTPRRDTAGQLERRAVKHEQVDGPGQASRNREPVDALAPEPCSHVHIRCGPGPALHPAAMQVSEARARRAEALTTSSRSGRASP